MANLAAATPLIDVTTAVDDVLDRFLRSRAAEMITVDGALAPLAEVASDAVLAGGKRIRPAFAYWGWRGAAGDTAAVAGVLPALAALELLHAFALVHDDIMDASDTRRGRPTAHRAFAERHARAAMRGRAARFGMSSAILVGDLCLVWADELMTTATVADDVIRAARRVYDRMRIEAISGQFLDILGDASRTASVEYAWRTAELKTASYTVVRPLLFGAALADPDTDRSAGLTAAYTRFGHAAGVAFQLRDDLLDLYGDTETVGKPVGQDSADGKPTVVLQLARSFGTPRQVAQLERAVRRRAPQQVAALVEATGARARVEQMIDGLIADARSALADAPVDADTRAALGALAHDVAWRSA